MNNKGRSNKSLCERSMKMMTNIVNVSYISFAKASLGPGGAPAAQRRRSVVNNPPQPQFPNALRSQEPQNSLRPISYLMQPGGGDNSVSVIREEESVDCRASDYIRRVHEKNRNHASEMSKLSEFIVPPPPRRVLYPTSSL